MCLYVCVSIYNSRFPCGFPIHHQCQLSLSYPSFTLPSHVPSHFNLSCQAGLRRVIEVRLESGQGALHCERTAGSLNCSFNQLKCEIEKNTGHYFKKNGVKFHFPTRQSLEHLNMFLMFTLTFYLISKICFMSHQDGVISQDLIHG